MAVRTAPATPATTVLCEEVDGVLYPIEEDEHVTQGSWHFETVLDAVCMVRNLLRSWPSPGIFSDMFVYWARGRAEQKCAPDLIVLPEIDEPRRSREALYLWKEQTPPVFVMEVLSPSTGRRDLSTKLLDDQDDIGIPEYFICDARELPRRVWAYHVERGTYVAVAPDARGRLWSAQLQGWFGVDEDGLLRVWDADGQLMPRYHEATARAWAESQRAQDEARQREDAEARIRDLEAEIRRLRGEA